MYKTLENAIRSIQKDALDEELGEASKKRMKIKAVAREEESRDGEVPTRQGEIQNKIVDEAEDKKKMKLGGKKTQVIIDPEMDTKGSANQMKEEKDEREYGYEGEMATSQLKSIIQNAEAMLGMLQDGTDLPEWVQSKITLAQDYIMSAKDYLSTEMSEEVEQIDEKLKGKQHKIDANKNEKIDAHDFELLRKKKKFAESNGVTDSLLDAVKSVVEARKPGQSMQMALDAAAKQKKLQDTLAGKSPAFAPKKEPEVKKEEVEQVDEAFVVYHKKNKNIVSKHSNHATAKKHAEKRGDDFAVASHEYWQDKIKPMKEEVELSDDELARLESIAKKFD